ncbi:hypothetical protein ABH926_008419 [Catenulispora sp. GP43]|uniref:hypothetical protein n=1 Tax=Catenulispora sp. GP43 TaxID=3156263 RepID=UPI003517E4C4
MRERGELGERRDSYDEYGGRDEYDGGHEYRGRAPYEGQGRGQDRGQNRDEWRGEARVGRRRSRVPLVVATVVVVLAGGGFGVVESGVLSKKSATPAAGGQSSEAPAAAATTPSTQPSAPPTAPQILAGQAGLAAPIAGAGVGTFYGIVQHALDPNGHMASDAAATPTLFASASQFHTYWSSAGKPTAGATCGAKASTLAVVETPVAAESGSGATVRVDLFDKGKLAPKAASVDVDASGKIESIKCVASAMPGYAGLSFIVSTYGMDQIPSKEIRSSHAYAPTSQDAAAPEFDGEWNVCAQYLPGSWVFYAPVTTSAGAAWRYSYDQVTYSNPADLFVDPSTGDVQRVICEGLPSIPASDIAAAGKDSHTYGGDPADALVMYALQAYARERSLVSSGAKPTSEVAPYFASADAFQTDLTTTGKVPLLCADKDPFGVSAKGIGTVNGNNESVEISVLGAPTDGNRSDAPTIGTATYTVDLTTMKITGVACH